MKADIFPKLRRTGIVTQSAENELLIYDLETNQAFCLNETSALVYEMCDGTKSISEISRTLGTKSDSGFSEELVWLALDQLRKEKLIENESEISNHFAGVSRRDVIKKIGLSSMIALPVVASIIAPASVSAQSCVGAGGSYNAAVANCGGPTQATACSTTGLTRCCSMSAATPISPSDCTASGGVTCICP